MVSSKLELFDNKSTGRNTAGTGKHLFLEKVDFRVMIPEKSIKPAQRLVS